MFFPRIDSSQCSGATCTLPLPSFILPLACTWAWCQRLYRTKPGGCCQSTFRDLQQIQSRLFLTLNRRRRTLPGAMSPLCISSERCLLLSPALPCISALRAFILKLIHFEVFPNFRLLPWWLTASSVSTSVRGRVSFLRDTDAAAAAAASLKVSGAGFNISTGVWSVSGPPEGCVESFSFIVAYAFTNSICFWRFLTKACWRVASSTMSPFNKRFRRHLGALLHRKLKVLLSKKL